MSAGASVCYPSQTVAVLKVTGKKVYAAGLWSSAAVSSLLTYKSQEPVAKEIAAAHPQAATVPNPESAVVEEASEPSSVQSATIPETEVELALSVPVSDEHIVTVITEEASSVTLTDKSPDQTPTETIAVPAETETTTTSGEIPAPVESEEPSDTKNAQDVSPDSSPGKPTLSLEPEMVEASPVEVTLVEAALPVEAEAAPVEDVSSSEEPPAPKASDEAAVPVGESGEPEPAVQPELADPPQVAAVEETLTPTPPQQSAAEISKGGTGFKPDPAVMDFGQSDPEDEDLYSTRS